MIWCLRVGDVVNGYIVVRGLSYGLVSCVFEAKMDGKTYAIKQVHQIYDKINEAFLDLVKSVSCRYLVEYKDVFISESKHSIFFVMNCYEYELAKEIKMFKNDIKVFPTVQRILDVFCDLTIAIFVLHHSLKIVHRDIVPENVFVDEGNVCRLGDYGTSKLKEQQLEVMTTFCGIPNCMAPEVIMRKSYSYSCNLFSLGATIYELCELQPLPRNQFEPFEALFAKSFENKEVPENITTLMKELVSLDPTDRPTIETVALLLRAQILTRGTIPPVLSEFYRGFDLERSVSSPSSSEDSHFFNSKMERGIKSQPALTESDAGSLTGVNPLTENKDYCDRG